MISEGMIVGRVMGDFWKKFMGNYCGEEGSLVKESQYLD